MAIGGRWRPMDWHWRRSAISPIWSRDSALKPEPKRDRDFSYFGKPRRRRIETEARSHMTSVDLGVRGVMFLSGLLAFSRGLVREVLSIGAWLGAAAVAIMFLPN